MATTRAKPGTAPGGPAAAGVTNRQEAAAALVAGGLTLTEAARQSKCGLTTLKRWAKEPAFAKRVSEIRSEMTSAAVGVLAATMASAADTLRFLARNAKQEAVRLAAARSVLELGVKLRESVELAERVAALESTSPAPTPRPRRPA